MPGRMWTKMLSSWKEKSAEYFRDGLNITDISILLDVSRQSIAKHIQSLPDYDTIKAKRQADNRAKRKEYKRTKQKQYREADGYAMRITGETLRREHELAAIELSKERYH